MKLDTFHPKYRPDIDGLRAIAVLAVVAFHAFPEILPGGFVGVDVFFVISGFLISNILFQNMDRGSFSAGDFYSRRIRRIFPALVLILFTVMFLGWLCLFPEELRQLGIQAAASIGFVQNFVLWKESGYFDSSSEVKPLLHIWSLGIEEQFYFLWPPFLYYVRKLAGAKYGKYFTFIAAGLVFAVSFILNINLVKIDPTKTFYLPQYRVWELAAGSLLAWVSLYGLNAVQELKFLIPFRPKLFHSCSRKIFLNFLGVFGVGILAILFKEFTHETIFPGKRALLPVLAATFIIFSGQNSFINKKILANKILVWVGIVSFPLYLWHWPLLSFGRIICGEKPTTLIRLLSVTISLLLSWLTAKFIEKPFRFGEGSKKLKLVFLAVSAVIVLSLGLIIYSLNGRIGQGDSLKIQRQNTIVVGMSERWLRGKGDWLFLGDSYDRNLSKLTLSKLPSATEVKRTSDIFSELAEKSMAFGIKVALIIGVDKPDIYSEFLPDEIKPSPKKYSSFFLEKLEKVPNFIVYDPTNDLLSAKKEGGLLYWMTDTHWNRQGAYIAFVGFCQLLKLPFPKIEFRPGPARAGDLIKISGLSEFPLHSEDNRLPVWNPKPMLVETDITNQKKSSFGSLKTVSNLRPLSNKIIWVVGDSFSEGLREYFDATFKEVHYIGHWGDKLSTLSADLVKADVKPDMIIVVRVERSF